MSTGFVAAAWVVGLAIALYASEKLVHYLSELGSEIHIPVGLLGLLVAFGADAPEISSALIAVIRGSPTVGLSIILGSNIYNLAGLLGLSAIIARRITTNRHRTALDGGTNVLLTLALLGVVLISGLHLLFGIILLVLFLAYGLVVSGAGDRIIGRLPRALHRLLRDAEAHPPPVPKASAGKLPLTVALVLLSVVFIVIGSAVLVNTSLSLGSSFGLSSAIVGTLVLAIATSLPNTWAALSLARRGFGTAAIAATFSSNSINAALGAGLPSLFLSLHLSKTAGAIEAPWLLAMTGLALVLLATRLSLAAWEGLLLIAAYAGFVAVFLISLY